MAPSRAPTSAVVLSWRVWRRTDGDTVAACGPSSSNVLAPTDAVSRTRCESFLSCSSSDPRETMLDVTALAFAFGARPLRALACWNTSGWKVSARGRVSGALWEKATTRGEDSLLSGRVSGAYHDAKAGKRGHGEDGHRLRCFVERLRRVAWRAVRRRARSAVR